MTPIKRFEALHSTYTYATKQQLPTTVSIEPRHSYSIVLRYIQWNHDTRMDQGTDQMHLLLQGFVSKFFSIYFTFSVTKSILHFAQDLLYRVHYIKVPLYIVCFLFCIIFVYACHVRTLHVNFVVSLLFRCGFASETSPRHVIRSVLTHTINGQVSCHRNTTSMRPNVKWLGCDKVRFISRSSQ